ncbi:MAG: dihydroorotase [Dysgonamonadaceae bacterium]|nr:dihydroorotase [Dysgonamonadaceae bacterium]MDD4729245.1 dihydroorotase [Dysgonamonadaceae bacterium]
MLLIRNATIINEGTSTKGSVLIKNDKIDTIYHNIVPEHIANQSTIIEAEGLYLIPGVIDDQVHFREPGLTHKGDIQSESSAAIAGGVTSYMEMPNTIPQTITIDEWEKKNELAHGKSYANYAFYLGSTNDNLAELKKATSKHLCGIKVFMGASTGNMLVDDKKTLQAIFAEVDMLIATHCEKESIIRKNIDYYKKEFGEDIPIKYHPLIRSAEACYESSAEAIELADRYGSRLHVLHLSTGQEMRLFDAKPLSEKKITAEVCVHHLWFTDEDYDRLGTRIKWNPAVKTKRDRDELRNAVLENKLDVIATDHAPHTLQEKEGGALTAASGGPLVQHSLQMMMQLVADGIYSKEQVIEKMCHAPAKLFGVKQRGFIRKGYFADLVLVNPNKSYTVTKDNILYKCGWSPLEGETLSSNIQTTILNGKVVFHNGEVVGKPNGQALEFVR